MTSSMYLYIYILEERTKKEFSSIIKRARNAFRIIWNERGTGVDKDDKIIGLLELFSGLGYNNDSDNTTVENFLKVNEIDNMNCGEYFSFNHCNGCYKDSYLDNKETIHMNMIYEIFAEIIACVSNERIFTSMSSATRNYSLIFDSEGNKYKSTDDKNNKEYYNLVCDKFEYENNLKDINEQLKNINTEDDKK
jgi:hypothetical protein